MRIEMVAHMKGISRTLSINVYEEGEDDLFAPTFQPLSPIV